MCDLEIFLNNIEIYFLEKRANKIKLIQELKKILTIFSKHFRDKKAFLKL